MKRCGFRPFLGGLVGTVAITIVMYALGLGLAGRAIDVAAVVAKLLGVSLTAGMVVHVVLGSLAFPLIYLGTAARWTSVPHGVRGTLFGIALWILAEAIVVPAAGGGFFHGESGGFTAALVSALGHAFYGAVLGAFSAARDRPDRPVTETPLRDVNRARASTEAAEQLSTPRVRPSDRGAWRSGAG